MANQEIERRRTFAIIAHPDAGKTSLTEKLLGHQDFAEDTYRTLTAVDSVIIVVDGAKGVETQTRKLMEVCRMRNTPVIIFVNKMDREAKDPFDLLDELEEELVINVRPLTWPIESGPRFKGVYNIYEHL